MVREPPSPGLDTSGAAESRTLTVRSRSANVGRMHSDILALAIEFALQTVFLILGLWIMIKLQKLDYNVLGLLGAAALASGLDMIPLAGHYIAVPVLYLCIAKVTRADLYPDAVFTVVIAYALMFAMNVFLIGALMGDLRPS